MTMPAFRPARELAAIGAIALSPAGGCFHPGGRGCGHCGTNGVKRWPACNEPVPTAVALAGTWHSRFVSAALAAQEFLGVAVEPLLDDLVLERQLFVQRDALRDG